MSLTATDPTNPFVNPARHPSVAKIKSLFEMQERVWYLWNKIKLWWHSEREREEEGRIVAASASANEFLNWQRWKLQLLVRQVFSSSSCCMSVCLPDGQSSDNSNREDSEYCSMLLYYLLLISSLPPPPPVHLLCAHTGLAKCICMRLDIIRTLTHKRRMTMRWPLRWWTSKRRRRKVNG